MSRVLAQVREAGVTTVVFGDLFLVDPSQDFGRRSRGARDETRPTSWRRKTTRARRETARVACVPRRPASNPKKLDRPFAAGASTPEFLAELLETERVPAGRNGPVPHASAWGGLMLQWRLYPRIRGLGVGCRT